MMEYFFNRKYKFNKKNLNNFMEKPESFIKKDDIASEEVLKPTDIKEYSKKYIKKDFKELRNKLKELRNKLFDCIVDSGFEWCAALLIDYPGENLFYV